MNILNGGLRRQLNSSEEWALFAFWLEGLDTYDISLKLAVHECVVANRLMLIRCREQHRMMQGGGR